MNPTTLTSWPITGAARDLEEMDDSEKLCIRIQLGKLFGPNHL